MAAPAVRLVVDWGILHPDGHVESAGMDPGGNVHSHYSEDMARLLASSYTKGGVLVRRTRYVLADIVHEWETVDPPT